MAAGRLSRSAIEALWAAWPPSLRTLGYAARDRVLDVLPAVTETVAFGALAYVAEGKPYGVIGGSVRQIERRRDGLVLAFLHGAFLPDPEGLLRGTAKVKRTLTLHAQDDLSRPAVAALLRAAVAHDPGSPGGLRPAQQ